MNSAYFVPFIFMRKAVFFDRDGVLNREIGDYVCRLDDFEVLQDSAAAIKMVRERGYLAIVITNQGGIDKELYDHQELSRIHARLQESCMKVGTMIDDFYYCPHHPLKGKCMCRKPDSLMLEKALAKHHINRHTSLMIGDTFRDIEAATKAGIRSLLIQPNSEKIRLLEDELNKLEACNPI